MKNILIIGAGRFGRYCAMKLHEFGHQVMMVDRKEARINEVMPYVTMAEIGDSTDELFLKSIGVNDYDICIVAIGDDFISSLETTFLLYELKAKLIIARANNEKQEALLLRNGASQVIFPERELGTWTAIRYSIDNLFNYFAINDDYGIFELAVPEMWANKKIKELDVRKKYGITILAIKEDEFNFDVTIDTVLRKGETLLVLGTMSQIMKIK